MIRKENLRKVLTSLGYKIHSGAATEVWKINFQKSNSCISIDFSKERISYPAELKAHRETTKNFSSPENFVVLECITRLLTLGYFPNQLELEKPMPGGHSDTGGYCDILIKDNEENEFALIECKTADDSSSREFTKAWHKMLDDGGQLFNYFNSYRKARALCLYASDWQNEECTYRSYIVSMEDNEDYLRADKKLRGYKNVAEEKGGKDEYFKVWQKTYDLDYSTVGIFEQGIAPFTIGKRVLSINDLREADEREIQKKYHEYATIMRQHNVSGRENAFDKLVNLFLAKIVDEAQHPDNLQFNWRGAAHDDYYNLQDRLQQMYSRGMKEFLGEEVTYIDNKTISDSFYLFKNDPDATKEKVLEYFRQLKFYTNNDFAFLDVHNQVLFCQNAEILKKVVRMLQDMRLRTDKPNQFLGDLFEGFLDQGIKQSEGQFFTPMPIVRFIISSLPLLTINDTEQIPKVIDYACGAGHFLNEYAEQIKTIVEQRGEDIKKYYLQVFGIEKEYRLSKVAKVSAFMYGQDDINIIYQDALQPNAQIKDGTFSVLVANPPYSVKGFLEMLTEEERSSYILSQYVSDASANNSIEVFFIERAAQLLRAGGVAAIILPSSVLSNGGIYSHARELILQQFSIVAIVEFASGTFGKTGTNTITLFLRKREDVVPAAEHYRNRVKAWFSGDFSKDGLFADAHLLDAYCQMQGIARDLYSSLLRDTPDEALWQHDLFKAYRVKYGNKAEQNFKDKKITVKYTNAHKQAEIKRYIVESVRSIEQDKLYYYLLAKSNPLPVLIVKSPTKTAEIKQFLGYEWSNRKGSEGIKYIGAAEAFGDEIKINKGLDCIRTPLFNPANFADTNYINSLVRSCYLGDPLPIAKELEGCCSTIQVEKIIDFKRADWDLRWHIMGLSKYQKLESQYSTELLGNLLIKVKGLETKIPRNRIGIEGNIPVVTQEKENLIAGYINDANPITDLPLVLFGDHSCSIKYIDFPFVRGADGTQLIKVQENKILHKYLFHYLHIVRIENQEKYERHFKYLKTLHIPLPPLTIQQQIVDECAKVDEEYENSRMAIEDYRAKISKIFTDLEVIVNSDSGGGELLNISRLCFYVSEKIDLKGIRLNDYVTTDNLLQNKQGCVPFVGIPNIDKVTAYQEDDVLVSNIRPYLKKIWFADRKGGCSNDVLVFRLTDKTVLPKYFYYSLSQDAFFDYVMQGVKGVKMPRGDKAQIMNFAIPIPSLDKQKEIVAEVESYESAIAQAQSVMNSCASRKAEILKHYLQ